MLYCPTNAANYLKIVKNQLNLQKSLQHVLVHAGTIIRELQPVLR